MSDEMRLLMAQVDDVSGELLGEFIQRVEKLGARNVQAVASITKKGRPGYLVYIDVPASLEDDVADLLGGELGTWGYRVLAAEHKHFSIERATVRLELSIGDYAGAFEIGAKTISRADRFTRVKVEHDDLSRICATLRDHGHHVPLSVLKAQTECRLLDGSGESTIHIRL